jgi:putative ABC transport system ATP-binding protein
MFMTRTDRITERPNMAKQSRCLVQTQALTKTFEGGALVHALEDVSLAVAEGEFLAILGPSGSGKSTLLNLIGTLDQPTSGQIVIRGVELSTLHGDALADFRREMIGFVFQLFNLVPSLNALENVALPLLPYRHTLRFNLERRARELLTSMGLGERIDHLPGQLAGGEQQRVAIARALINSPHLILADEPTGNLDMKTGQEIVDLLHDLNREEGLTLIVVTHDSTIASQADRIVQLRDGRLQAQTN